MGHHVIPNPTSNPTVAPTYQNHKQQKWREPITRVLQTPSLREHFSAKTEIPISNAKTHSDPGLLQPTPRARLPGPLSSQVSPPFPNRLAQAPTSPNHPPAAPPRQPSVQLAASGPQPRVWGELDPRTGPEARLRDGPAPALFPYRSLGDVAPLGDVLAVLLVGHTDSLLGDHLHGATTCPSHPAGLSSSPPLGPLRRAGPGACAAGARRLSGRALAPAAGPGRGERGSRALAGRGAADWLTTPDWPAEKRARGTTAGRRDILAPPLWPPPGAWSERGRKRNATTEQCCP